jgi:hypothetical protein
VGIFHFSREELEIVVNILSQKPPRNSKSNLARHYDHFLRFLFRSMSAGSLASSPVRAKAEMKC